VRLYKRIQQMEKPYAELSDQDLARAIAGNHAAIQNYWTQVSGLAGGKGGDRGIDSLACKEH
jgi:hypothetical protein